MNSKLQYAAVIVLALLTALGVGYMVRPKAPSETVHYPYVCQDCKAVFDISELKKPGNYQHVPGAAGSVAYCLRCKKGKAYPVAKCEQCGTRHILYIVEDDRCPKCFPEAAKAAQAAGIDVIFKGE